jgi:hypothetical protein
MISSHRPICVLAFSRTVLATLITLAACVTGHCQFTTLAYDGFSYSTGSLSGQNGGTGWSSPWTNDYHSGASFNVSATGRSILNTSLNPAADGSSSSSASLSSLNLVVARIDYQPDTTMWVNPNLLTFDYENPGTPNADYSALAPAFDTVEIDSRSPTNFDELSILFEPAPEPASTLFIWLGLAILAIGVRLDKRSR